MLASATLGTLTLKALHSNSLHFALWPHDEYLLQVALMHQARMFDTLLKGWHDVNEALVLHQDDK